jgi:hypothetical protein
VVHGLPAAELWGSNGLDSINENLPMFVFLPDCRYDIHATMVHQLELYHTKLIYRNNGIDRRLSDVHGQVIREIIG